MKAVERCQLTGVFDGQVEVEVMGHPLRTATLHEGFEWICVQLEYVMATDTALAVGDVVSICTATVCPLI